MCEILFRGKRTDNGEWVKGYYCNLGGNHPRILKENIFIGKIGMVLEFKNIDVLPETVGQYTGLTDKNGTKIFEGDIVSYFKKDILNSEVIYKDGCFMFRFISEFTQRMRQSKQEPIFDNVSMCGEVIGNIHDNPELLETAAKPVTKNIAQSGLAPATENFELMES